MSMLCNVIMLLLLYVHVCVTRTGWKTRPRPKTVILSIKKSNQIKSNLFLSSLPPLPSLSLSHASSCARSLFCPPPPPPFLVLECLSLPVRLTVSLPLPHCFFLSAPVCISLPNRQTGRQIETQKQTHAHTHTHTHTHMVVKSLDWGVYQSNM